jgi:hypothetical protein
MKNLAVVLFCVFVGIRSAFAGPFGIDMGMSLAEVRSVCKTAPVHVEGDLYQVSPSKSSGSFDMYAVSIDPDYGVYWLKALGKDIHTNGYGRELRSEFNNIVESIGKTYGQHQTLDFCEEDEVFDDPKYFMYTLEKGGRMLAALWNAEFLSKLPDDITGIAISAHALSDDKGYIALEYEFANADEVEAKAATVF